MKVILIIVKMSFFSFFFFKTHLICAVPEYHNLSVDKAVDMQIIVKCRGKMSDPHDFLYKPCKYLTPTTRSFITLWLVCPPSYCERWNNFL